MTLFAANGSQLKQEIISRLEKIALAIQNLSDRKLVVGYEGGALMGEGNPFYHISYPVSILDRRHPVSVFQFLPGEKDPVISPTILTFDLDLGSYLINEYLSDPVKETIKAEIKKLDPDAKVREVGFVN